MECFSDYQAKGSNKNADKLKTLVRCKIICVSPLVPAATAEKVGPNEASILLCR